MLDDLARRTVLARVAAAVAALAVLPAEARRKKKKKKKKKKGANAPPPPPREAPSPPPPPGPDVVPAFVLVTGCRGDVVPPCACNACELHAANKLFASREAVVRAHTGCNCRVEALSLPRATWLALFQATSAVDKRDPRVQQIL